MGVGRRLLLLSGGLDSTALGVWQPCDGALTIDYGQRPAEGELRAARAIAAALGLRHAEVKVDAGSVGAGLLAGQEASSLEGVPIEWWPFRNQLLITIAASFAVTHNFVEVLVGSVAGDGLRHADGGSPFFDAIDALTRIQEGAIRVSAPATHLTALELMRSSGATRGLLAWCHSCHRSSFACGECPGCWKRAELLVELE